MIEVIKNWAAMSRTCFGPNAETRWQKNQIVFIAESKEEAIEKEVLHYLDKKPCRHGHTALLPDGKTHLNRAIRYRCDDKCVSCKHASQVRSSVRRRKRRTDPMQIANTDARRRREDLEIAKAAGITLEELYGD